MFAWRIATETPAYGADDLTGAGAKATGGRWNLPTFPIVYCADSPSLACLETMAHLGTGSLPMNRILVKIDIPNVVWNARETQTPLSLPVGWDVCPAGSVCLNFGTAWLTSSSSAVLLVPSVVVPEDFAVLINPRHPDAASITAKKIRRWLYDPRMGRLTA